MISVLLADDHAIVRSGIKLLINSQPDMEVLCEAEDGIEAVTLALEKKPDVVIMDLKMPKRNGLLAIKKINEANSDIKIIALTMHEEKAYIFRAIQAGASGYLLKSHHENDLIKAIRTVYHGNAFLYPGATKFLLEDYLKKASSSDEDYFEDLTGREQEVLSFIAKGYTNQEVAEQLHLSIKTIEAHRSNIMDKLHISTRRELVQYAMNHGFLDTF